MYGNSENDMMKDLSDKLAAEIAQGLPGTDVQWEMASSDRMLKGFPRTPRADASHAAVLILLYPIDNTIHTLFIQRPDYEGVHGGQVGFPGGKREQADNDLVMTALREASEETGVIPSLVKLTGILTPLYIPVSNIIVTPVVGWSDNRPVLTPDHNEVVYIIEAPLTFFLDGSILRSKPFDIRGDLLDIRYFDFDGHVIWGATAMMLHELLVLMRRANLSAEV